MVGPGFTVNDFRSNYKPRCPKWKPEPVEALPITTAAILPQAPAMGVFFGRPGDGRANPATNTYIWVIDENGIPYVLDESLAELCGRRPKHTNLTGGRMAYAGGEMWFEAVDKLYISGGSGRYEPCSVGQLEDSRRVFESLGYSVSSLGWNPVRGKPARVLGEI